MSQMIGSGLLLVLGFSTVSVHPGFFCTGGVQLLRVHNKSLVSVEVSNANAVQVAMCGRFIQLRSSHSKSTRCVFPKVHVTMVPKFHGGRNCHK